MEGGEAKCDIKHELMIFISHGIISWMRQYKDKNYRGYEKLAKRHNGSKTENLTVLLANLAER